MILLKKKLAVGSALLAISGALMMCAGGLWAQDKDGADAAANPKAELQTNAAGAQIAVEAPDAGSDASAKHESPLEAFHKRFASDREKGVGINRNAIVVMGRSVVLKANESAETVVVIGGSAKILGKVREEVVVIGGDIDVQGEVGQEVVAVMGGVKVGPTAKLYSDLVAVGGKAEVEEGAEVHGQTQEVDMGGMGLPNPEWLRKWFIHCVLKLRPLAPQVGWVWGVAGMSFLFYLLVAAAFPRPVEACVEGLTRRPATTFVMGLLTVILSPVVLLILTVTVMGPLVVLTALFLGVIVGKVAILEWIGFQVTRQASGPAFQKPVIALFVGAIIITSLYMIPVLGLLTFGIIGSWGLGSAVTAAFAGLRRELPDKSTPAAPVTPIAPEPPAEPRPEPAMATAGGGSLMGSAESWKAEETAGPQVATATLAAAAAAALPEALVFPRAGFWERMAAAFLDMVLVGILSAPVHGPPLGFLVALAYFAGMWGWKGTTIGGIVLGLKVVRPDGQPITFTVALVRALAAAFSAVVLFLGFIWIAWDPEKQGWHDRIAGTVVVRLPRGTPLVCF
jgi:uncharacterized RDD family membrane protein YckC